MSTETEKVKSLKIVKRPNIDVGVIEFSTKEIDKSTDHDFSETLSPKTPSSKFSTSVVQSVYDGIINCMLLCHWDNILGPRIAHLWTVPNKTHFSHDILNKICSQSLSGEICRDCDNCFIDYKFFTNTEEGLVTPVFIFTANTYMGPAVHSISLLINKSDLGQYLQIQHLVIRCMERLISKLRILLHKPATSSEEILSSFFMQNNGCIDCISLLKTRSLSANIKLAETYFFPAHTLEREFLHDCIFSHLLTFGKTLVIGDKEESINMMIHTLSLFNIDEEKKCSLLFKGEDPMEYHHDLWIQGMHRQAHHRIELPAHELLYSKYPSSLIDITANDIKQTLHLSDHVIHSYNSQKNELLSIMGGENTVIPSTPGEFLLSHTYTETLVTGLLDDLDKLPSSCGVREAYIAQFMKTISMKALCLVKYLEGETNSGAQIFKGGLKRIRHDLCLPADGDLMIVLAAAEKLKPGIYWFLMKDYYTSQNSNY